MVLLPSHSPSSPSSPSTKHWLPRLPWGWALTGSWLLFSLQLCFASTILMEMAFWIAR